MPRATAPPGAALAAAILVFIFSSACCLAADSGPTTYSYDSASHLVQATNATGDGVQLQSDANGNTVSASAVSTTALTLGTVQGVQINTPGASAVLTVTVPANQSPLALALQSLTTAPGNSPITLDVYNSTGTLIASRNSTASTVLYLPTALPAGTYTVVVAPQNGATASMQVAVETAGIVAAPAGDGPVPLWAYAVLACVMLLSLRRVQPSIRPTV
jgi:YD repeat-containing protein